MFAAFRVVIRLLCCDFDLSLVVFEFGVSSNLTWLVDCSVRLLDDLRLAYVCLHVFMVLNFLSWLFTDLSGFVLWFALFGFVDLALIWCLHDFIFDFERSVWVVLGVVYWFGFLMFVISLFYCWLCCVLLLVGLQLYCGSTFGLLCLLRVVLRWLLFSCDCLFT